MYIGFDRQVGEFICYENREPMLPIDDALYLLGEGQPRFPVPAPILEVEYHDEYELGPFHSSVLIYGYILCKCCGGLAVDIVALWDFNWDRAMDFNIPYGKYTRAEQVVYAPGDQGVLQ